MGLGFGYGIDCTMGGWAHEGTWACAFLVSRMGEVGTWGVLALALAAVFGFWFCFWLRYSFVLFHGGGFFCKKGVVYPVTVFGLIMYIYPHAISLLFFLFH